MREDCNDLLYTVTIYENKLVVGIAPQHVPYGTLRLDPEHIVLCHRDIFFWLDGYYSPGYRIISGERTDGHYRSWGRIIKSAGRGRFEGRQKLESHVVISDQGLRMICPAVKEELGLSELSIDHRDDKSTQWWDYYAGSAERLWRPTPYVDLEGDY